MANIISNVKSLPIVECIFIYFMILQTTAVSFDENYFCNTDSHSNNICSEFKVLETTSILKENKTGSVLMYLPMSTVSHANSFFAIANTLAAKGHSVTMVVPKDSERIITAYASGHDINTILVDVKQELLLDVPCGDSTASFTNIFLGMRDAGRRAETVHRDALSHPDMKAILKQPDRTTQYDVVLVPAMYNEVGYFLADTLNAPLVLLMTRNINQFLTLSLGYFDNPTFVTMHNHMTDQTTSPNFFTKFELFFMQCVYLTMKRCLVAAVQERLLQTLNLNENDDVNLMSLEAEAVFGMYSTHYIFDSVTPKLPNSIDIGFIHCRQPKTLGKELRDWFEQSDERVVYVSFGSLISIETTDVDILNVIRKATHLSKYRFIIKSKEHLFSTKTVLVCEWCPQQDILGHPKTAVFISHAGLYSLQEAIYHKVPVIAIPFRFDQFGNAERVNRQGYGKRWTPGGHKGVQGNAEALCAMISDMAKSANNSYKDNIDKVNGLVLGTQMETPLERAVFWTEYIMRNKGAPFLKSPSRHLSYFTLLYFDIYLFLLFWAIVVAYILYKSVQGSFRLIKRCMRIVRSIGWNAIESITENIVRHRQQ